MGLVCEEARIPGGAQYFEPRGGGLAFDVDHERQECTAAAPKPPDDSLERELIESAERYRIEVERELDRYVTARFPRGRELLGPDAGTEEVAGASAFVKKGEGREE